MKILHIFLICILISLNSNSQDLFNFYRDYSAPGPSYRLDEIMDTYFEGKSIFTQSYNGEYVIYANDLPWTPNMLSGPLNNLDLTNFLLTYEVEVVSFPFMPNGAFEGAADGLSIRNLYLPAVLLSPNGNRWICSSDLSHATELWNKTNEYAFENSPTGDVYADQSHPNTLASYAFRSVGGFDLDRIVLPHTILKHTIRFYCGRTTSDQVLSTIVFYNDLTRGTMREYPFNNSNSYTSPTFHDVIVSPRITASTNCITNIYGKSSQCDFENPFPGVNTTCDGSLLLDTKANIINYTPFNLSDDDFCNIVPSTSQVNSLNDHSYYGVGNGSYTEHLPIPNYALVNSTGTKNYHGEYPAGYSGVNSFGFLNRLASSPVVHQYWIDQNILLDLINPIDKVIFNPSEAWVTASDLRFPTNYTFKTIRAIYPYLQDVLAENTDKNGGPYEENDSFDPNYLTNLNVTTDLFKDFHIVDPAYPSDNHKYASIYHLDNGGKITIEPCVRIFDATFEVNPGSEIAFENWSTNQINVERYQLLYEGGTVTKGDENFLFQNMNEGRKILQYKAGNSIKVGENVDINSSPGTYTALSGAEIKFRANNFISLESGFDSELGSFLDAQIEPVAIPACGPLKLGRKNYENQTSNLEKFGISYFECSPNPINSNSVLMFKIGNKSNVTLQIFNSLGQLISTICDEKQMQSGSYTYNISKTDVNPGIYFAKLVADNESKSLKFIKP